MTHMILSILAIVTMLSAATNGPASAESSKSKLEIGGLKAGASEALTKQSPANKKLKSLRGKTSAGARTPKGGSLSAPADRRLPVIEGGGSFKQPCGMGHLGCLDGDPPPGGGWPSKK